MAKVQKLPLHHVRKKQYVCRLSLAAITIALSMLITTAAAYSVCNSDQFNCKDGSCILQEKMCDGRPDCPDNSDEVDCDSKMCRKPKWFACAQPNGPCLSAELMCNGIDNCPGGEDERDCIHGGSGGRSTVATSADVGTGGWHSSGRNCSEFEYTCQSDKSCIPLNFMCDGNNDCQDGSDELAGCIKARASCRGFFCSNNKCLESPKWLCDGMNDCGDGSDERNCPTSCKPELDKFLCHDNSTCLELSKACDGHNDCADGSDESSLCSASSVNCSTKTCPPAAKCVMLPASGPECLCPKGYRHSILDNACVDINECLENYGICSQGCENFSGGYKCTCDASYTLLSDNKTCEAHGAVEALMFYTTQSAVMGVHLRSKRVFTVAKNLTKVIGVSYDGDHVYWTNIQQEAESIVKANSDGTQQEILLTSGLDAPEDLAVDWLTGNIYFSDNVLRHIAVCTSEGVHCTVLVTIDVHHPRGVALWPQRGQMFWTDWGIKPMIARASMDGRNSLAIVSENIHWPNGIALDMHNDRIYWVDAKLATIESARPDGTDRRKVLDEILKHPYGVAVFEDNIYWSDWNTKSVHTCNKFTGKNHKVVTKDRTIYAVHIYHSAKQPKTEHACKNSRCSHLCLLRENQGFSCACPVDMQLSADQQRCMQTQKKQRLFIGIKNSLLEMEHTTFGRQVISTPHQLPLYINEMAYNSVNRSIFLADNVQRAIYEYDMMNHQIMTLARGNLGNVTGLAFDHLAHNLYWSDSERHVVEVLSLQTRQRAIVSFFSGIEVPIGISLVPEDGVMFIALRSRRYVHIDQEPLSGLGEHTHAFEDELGDDDIKFAVDYATRTLYWSDSDLGRISFTDYRNLRAYTFRSPLRRPYSIAIVDDDLFWSELKSPILHWTHKSNLGPLKRVEIEIDKETYARMLPVQLPLLASTPITRDDHPCQHDNGGCSHVCVTLTKYASACLCPPGLVYKDWTNRTCIETLDCEFRCSSGECLTQSRRCNGRKDCADGSDEMGCDASKLKKAKVICSLGQFMCHNQHQCIEQDQRCDGKKHCHDGSDELHCEKFDKSKQCHRHQHACDNGQCVDFSVMCDGANDCGDNSDEKNCKVIDGKDASTRPVCGKNMFQCNSGTCIAKSWECDGKIDCIDSSDEHDKCNLKECPSSMHKCLLGQCIDARLVCDGNNDCGDRSDELNCDPSTGEKRKMSCGDADHSMYQCTSNVSVCLELSAQCNGTAECPRGEDEADCGNSCSMYEFKCHGSRDCIRLEYRCDHEKDCADGSDELNCEGFLANRTSSTSEYVTHERACGPNMFECKDGQCVDLTRVCDGFHDCENGADEEGNCKSACKGPSGGPVCEHRCFATPTGAICSCFHGYKLNADKRSCVDVNECEELDPCAQLCENTHGSFRCSCYPEFMLRTDKVTCKSMESESALLFSTYDEVRSMTEQPIMLRVAWSANDTKINGFDLNVRKRHAYFCTESEDVLYMVDIVSGAVKAGLTVAMPSKVAVDWITDNVYVISRAQQYEIRICSFAAKMCGRILRANPREAMRALTVDAFNRKLFYVSTRAHAFGPPLSTISIANLDGNKREMLLTKSGSYITALAADPYKKLLYFADLHAKTLQAISYQLGSSRTPSTIIQKSSSITHPSGLSIYENQAFIVNIGSREAVRCHLFGARICKAFNLNILNAEDIIIDGVSRQPLNTNPCLMAKCAGICVQAEFGYECMCGDAVVEEKAVCSKDTNNEITSSALLVQSKAMDEDSTHITTAITLSLLLIALFGAAVGYMYYRRVKPGHRDLNINLHFQNPLSSSSSVAKSVYSGDSDTIGRSSTASFEANREKLHFSAPIYRFLRSSASGAGTEISLESPRHRTVQTLGSHTRMSNLMVEHDGGSPSDCVVPASGHYDDDARTRLVP